MKHWFSKTQDKTSERPWVTTSRFWLPVPLPPTRGVPHTPHVHWRSLHFLFSHHCYCHCQMASVLLTLLKLPRSWTTHWQPLFLVFPEYLTPVRTASPKHCSVTTALSWLPGFLSYSFFICFASSASPAGRTPLTIHKWRTSEWNKEREREGWPRTAAPLALSIHPHLPSPLAAYLLGWGPYLRSALTAMPDAQANTAARSASE